VLIANPLSQEQTLGRTWLLPGLLETVSRNTSREMPHRLFEVGPVLYVDSTEETGARQAMSAGAVLAGPGMGFADIRSVMEAVLRETGRDLDVRPLSRPYYIEGRAAQIFGDTGKAIGEMGEIHPAVLERFKLLHPVAAGELTIV
jgi:phenylalanyl-tRNA synthetase beta chain